MICKKMRTFIFYMNRIKNKYHGNVFDVQVFLTCKFSFYNDKFEETKI